MKALESMYYCGSTALYEIQGIGASPHLCSADKEL
jgi:hypothetical protein